MPLWSTFGPCEVFPRTEQSQMSLKSFKYSIFRGALQAFGDYQVPMRRSQKLSLSNQGLPALPESASARRYMGPGRINQFYGGSQSLWSWEGNMPPRQVQKVGAVLVVAGAIEVTRILLYLVTSALGRGL